MHLQRMRVILALTGFVEERHHTFSRTDLSNVVVDWGWDSSKSEQIVCQKSKVVKNAKKNGRKNLCATTNHSISARWFKVTQLDALVGSHHPKKNHKLAELPGVFFFPWRIGFFPTTLQELLGALFVENDPRRPPFPQPGTDHTIPYFLQLGDASFKRKQLSSSRSTRWAQNNSLKWHRATINGKMNG